MGDSAMGVDVRLAETRPHVLRHPEWAAMIECQHCFSRRKTRQWANTDRIETGILEAEFRSYPIVEKDNYRYFWCLYAPPSPLPESV